MISTNYSSEWRAGSDQIWRMFGAVYEQVDIISTGEADLEQTRQIRHPMEGVDVCFYRWRTLRKYYIILYVSRSLDDV
jgi:hypothetical protein